MHAGIYDKAAAAERQALQIAQPPDRIVVIGAELVAQAHGRRVNRACHHVIEAAHALRVAAPDRQVSLTDLDARSMLYVPVVNTTKICPDDRAKERDFVYIAANYGGKRHDLLIRTSGEMRVSNFLLWQIAYSELYFTPTLWPDFRREHLYEALLDFQCRERRFGQPLICHLGY